MKVRLNKIIFAIAIILLINSLIARRKRRSKSKYNSEIESKHLMKAEIQKKVDQCNSKCIDACSRTKDSHGNTCSSGYCFPNNFKMCYCWFIEGDKRFECNNVILK